MPASRSTLWLLSLLLITLFVRTAGLVLDFHAAVFYPFEIDYGEGIVWQQAALFGTARMYDAAAKFPFIIFHYPPIYYTLCWIVQPFSVDLLQAGRAVSVLASFILTLTIAFTVAGPGSPASWRITVPIGVGAGLTVLCSANVWSWGLLMRVDLVAIALSFAGLLAAHRARGRFWHLVVALGLCSLAVFTKQLQVSAGLSVLFVALLQKPRQAVLASCLIGGVSFLAFFVLQNATGGGFYRNVISYNVNPMSWFYFLGVLSIESRDTLILATGFIAAIAVGRTLSPWRTIRERLPADPLAGWRLLGLVHYGLCGLTLTAVAKEGSNHNYFIEFLASGTVLTGFTAIDLYQRGRTRWLNYQLIVLAVAAVAHPWRGMPTLMLAQDTPAQWALVEKVRQAQTPVSSENMTIIMRAGKSVAYEPAIITHLTNVGHWDETPLLDMIKNHAFAFMITIDDRFSPVSLRSPAVDAAMRTYYPHVEEAAPGLWVNTP